MSIFSSISGGDLLRTGATLGSAGLNYYASQRAADQASDAARRSTELQRQMFNINREDLAPYRAAGYGALDAQTSMLGLGVDPQAVRETAPWIEDRFEDPNYADPNRLEVWRQTTPNIYEKYLENRNQNVTNRLRETPGYQFRMDEGVQARDRSAAARGMALSGSQQKALTEFGQGLADQTYGQQLNRLASVAGTGQTATNTTARLGTNFAQGAGQNMMNAAQARGSSYLTGADQTGRAFNRLYDIWGGN